MRNLSIFLTCIAVLATFGCGGGSSASRSTTPTPVAATISVTPASATVALAGHQSFVVHASSGAVPVVSWSVNGVAGGSASVGTITSSGNYTAPADFPSNNMITVTATSTTNSAQKGNAAVTIVYKNDTSNPQSAPIQLGTSGGNNNDQTASTCCSGTLGALVQRDGKFFILSANHVLAKSDKGTIGDPIGQPGLVDNACTDGNVVAHLSQAAPLKTSNVDAAIAQVVSGQVDTTGSLLDLGAAGSTSIAAAPPSDTLAIPSAVLAANEGVAKVGRSSGLTCGTVQSISTNISVDYDQSCGGAFAFTANFNGQVVVSGGTFSASGDSGSLIVTSDTARPLALLYAGDNTSTVGNPIGDVLNALQDSSTKSFPTMVGGGDHAVSCAPTATAQSAQAAAGAAAVTLPEDEIHRATGVKEKFAASLMSDPAVSGVGVGASADEPGAVAVVVYLSGKPLHAIPAELDGVRTKMIVGIPFSPRTGSGAQTTASSALSRDEIGRGIAVKEQHASALLSQQGILGVGVGRSDDAAGESALVFYVETGKSHAAIPATIDGVRTKIIAGDRFRAFGWNEHAKPRACSVKPR